MGAGSMSSKHAPLTSVKEKGAEFPRVAQAHVQFHRGRKARNAIGNERAMVLIEVVHQPRHPENAELVRVAIHWRRRPLDLECKPLGDAAEARRSVLWSRPDQGSRCARLGSRAPGRVATL